MLANAGVAADSGPLLVGAVTFLLVVAFTLAATPPSTRPVTRLARHLTRRSNLDADPGPAGLRERLLSPLLHRLLEIAASTAPHNVRQAAAGELAMAGLSMSPTVFLAIRGVLTFACPLLVLTQVLGSGPHSLTDWGLVLTSMLIGRRLSGIWLKRKIHARQAAIERELPYALDLLVACLEAGLSLDAALAKVAEHSSGPLAVEIRKTLQEMSFGRPSVEAMRDLGERSGSAELRRLVTNILQAERMGVGISITMRALASESRQRRRQRAEEVARRAPIKMIPVLIFLVLPALAVVVVGPGVISLAQILGEQGM